ncbi:hypothetical protein LZC95_34715 [Pendulispora brunnea]|uniref:Uncharacterized protein n=1 Tax=Pendulispora brunnea TaxID=2905690 RepID=A0ABZ2K213_9BACT
MTGEELARRFAENVTVDFTIGRDAPKLGEKLVSLFEEGRRPWPKIELAPDIFVLHLARHAATSDCPIGYLDTVRAADLFLACGVAQGNRAAIAYFEEHFMAHVPEYILRIESGRDAIAEIQQRVRERLYLGRQDSAPSPKIAEYSGRGALGGWLRVVATRTALNHLRDKEPKSGQLRDEFAAPSDPELAYVHACAQDLFCDAFKRALMDLASNERAMLRLHYIDGLTMDQLSHLYKTPRSTIARRVAEVRRRILETTERLLRDERRMSPSAAASVIRRAQSQFEITMTQMLA